MTLVDLNAAWQQLRTAALGRTGLEQHVSAALASRVSMAYAGWERWYREAGFAPELSGSLHPEVASWLEQYRALAYDVRREGLQLPLFAESAGERLPDVKDIASSVIAPVAFVAAAAGAAWLWLRARRGRR